MAQTGRLLGFSKEYKGFLKINFNLTRRHSSRMLAAHMRFLQLLPDVSMKGSSKHVWTGLWSWSPDVTSVGRAGGTCMMRSNASWVIVTWEPPDRMTDTQTRLKKLPSHNFIGGRYKYLQILPVNRVPTLTGKPGKMGRHFPVREKLGNFEQTGKVGENHTKYWKTRGIWNQYYLIFLVIFKWTVYFLLKWIKYWV